MRMNKFAVGTDVSRLHPLFVSDAWVFCGSEAHWPMLVTRFTADGMINEIYRLIQN